MMITCNNIILQLVYSTKAQTPLKLLCNGYINDELSGKGCSDFMCGREYLLD